MTIALNRTLNTQKGFAHIAVMVLLLAGIVAGVYLVGQQTNIFPKAYSPKKPLSAPCTAAYCPRPTPIPSSKRVFITSTTYNGNLGGLSGADSKCQERANAVSLGGAWKAWVSDKISSPANRFSHSNGSYQLLNGTIIAKNWADLTDGSLLAAINLTEYKQIPSYMSVVWTQTTTLGNYKPPVSNVTGCDGFTVADENYVDGGRNGSYDSYWTENFTDRCDQRHPLYCFEQ